MAFTSLDPFRSLDYIKFFFSLLILLPEIMRKTIVLKKQVSTEKMKQSAVCSLLV